MRRLAAALLLVAAACGGGDGDGGENATISTTSTAPSTTTTAPPETTAAPSTTTAPLRQARAVRTVEVARLDQPLDMAARPGDGVLHVAEKTGRVRRMNDKGVVLDVTANLSQGYEQGLLGIAFSPDGSKLYANYTDRSGDTHVVEHDMAAPPTSMRELLFVDQPYGNHNGGGLAFGPDGLLYVALGDGGSGNDPQGNAQNLGTLLGKVLRIDPRPSGGQPYTVPASNPFVGRAGARPEIWAYGLRNPWRISFDRQSGDLWIADVGQGAWEEVNRQPAGSRGGENYEWVLREGRHRNKGERPPGGVEPVHEYSLAGGNCAVTGGYAYRGAKLTGFQGAYFFADFCAGELFVLRPSGNRFAPSAAGAKVEQLSSFGQDTAGELYALSLGGPVYRLDPVF